MWVKMRRNNVSKFESALPSNQTLFGICEKFAEGHEAKFSHRPKYPNELTFKALMRSSESYPDIRRV
jgi:hypothetical protein